MSNQHIPYCCYSVQADRNLVPIDIKVHCPFRYLRVKA